MSMSAFAKVVLILQRFEGGCHYAPYSRGSFPGCPLYGLFYTYKVATCDYEKYYIGITWLLSSVLCKVGNTACNIIFLLLSGVLQG